MSFQVLIIFIISLILSACLIPLCVILFSSSDGGAMDWFLIVLSLVSIILFIAFNVLILKSEKIKDLDEWKKNDKNTSILMQVFLYLVNTIFILWVIREGYRSYREFQSNRKIGERTDNPDETDYNRMVPALITQNKIDGRLFVPLNVQVVENIDR